MVLRDTIGSLRLIKVAISDRTTWLFLEVALADGAIGFGEATFFGWEEAIESALARTRRVFQGQFLHLPGEALALIDSSSVGPGGDVLRNALEQALLDILSRRASVPLCALLGGP